MKHQRKIIIAAILFALAYLLPNYNGWFFPAFMLMSYVFVGAGVIKKAFRNLFNVRLLDENFLMTIATFGAIALEQYSEAAGVMLFYQIGDFFQSYAVNKSRQSIAELMDICPTYANLQKGSEIIRLSPDEIEIGATIIIKPGERVPLDGEVIEGYSSLDASALTGEAIPQEVCAGDLILSGCVNLTGLLKVKVNKLYQDSTVSQILELVEDATNRKATVEQFITRFARWYTPSVVLSAILIAILPPLIFFHAEFTTWFYRALTFLVISCPCALVISVPLSFFGGIGAASRQGILIKGSNYLQALSEAKIIVFDKTGTLTKGSFALVEAHALSISEKELIYYAAYAGFNSNHPISQSIRQAFGKAIDASLIHSFQEIPSHGVAAIVKNSPVLVGNLALMQQYDISVPKVRGFGSVIYVAVNQQLAGWLRLADEIKPDSFQTIKELKNLDFQEIIMLTGDRKAAADAVAKKLGLNKVYSELLPADKVAKIEALLSAQTGSEKLIFVGDGINDAPVLARSDIGIAMGGLGSDAAIAAADVVIMTDEPSKIITAIQISRRTLRIVNENIIFALGIKFIVLGLGVVGLASMWGAIFADVGVSVIAILNALRALKFKLSA